MLHRIVRARRDDGAVAVLYAIVLAGIILPVFAVGSTALVRSTTNGELQRAADAGALAGASAIPFGDVNFADNYLAATIGGGTDRRLRDLGLSYTAEDPLDVACAVAMANASDATGATASRIATTATCNPTYISSPDVVTQLEDCAQGLTGPLSLPNLPDLSPLLPALLYPGVQVDMTWHVTGPFDNLINGSGADEKVSVIAHRRFKNMVVIPEVGLPTGQTINLNPLASNVRNTAVSALDETENLLSQNSATAECADALDNAKPDILDAIDPPDGGPDAQQILDDAVSSQSPLVIARVISAVDGLSIPYLDFVPVCVDDVGGVYVGHLVSFGACSLDAPGGFRASLRRS